MRNILTIAGRELKAYAYSPVLYVVMGLFVFFSGWLFASLALRTTEANFVMRRQFEGMGQILLFAAPILTMRLLAGEKRSGTIEALMTDPVTELQVVIGKFLAGFGFYLALLAPTVVFVAVIRHYGKADVGPIITGYAGLACMGLLVVSLGLFASALTRNQIVAAMVSLVLLVLMWLMPWLAALAGEKLRAVLGYIGIFERLYSFRKGVIDLRDVFFFLSTAALFLFLSVRALEIRKWR